MSRIGKAPIKIPNGTDVKINDGVVVVKGPKGELSHKILQGIEVKLEDGHVVFKSLNDARPTRAKWGLSRSLVSNMVKGVTEGFRKDLEIIGVGYRAAKKGNDLSISVGYSNPVEFKAPQGIQLNVEENTKISVIGVDKDLVGLTAAKIRAIRKPEPYKGKGIKYSTEVVRRKAGKAAGKTA